MSQMRLARRRVTATRRKSRAEYWKGLARKILSKTGEEMRVTVLQIDWPMRKTRVLADLYSNNFKPLLKEQDFNLVAFQLIPIFAGLANQLKDSLGEMNWAVMKHDKASVLAFLNADGEHLIALSSGKTMEGRELRWMKEILEIEQMLKTRQ